MERLTIKQLAKVLEAVGKIRVEMQAIEDLLNSFRYTGGPAFADTTVTLVEVKVAEVEKTLRNLSASNSLPPFVGGIFGSATTNLLEDLLAITSVEPFVRQLKSKGYEPEDCGLPSNKERIRLVRKKVRYIREAVDTIYVLLLERVSLSREWFDLVQLTTEVIRDVRTLRSIWLEVKGPAGERMHYRVVVQDPSNEEFTAPEVPVWGHLSALRLVIHELLVNAIKFSESPHGDLQPLRGRLPVAIQIRQESEKAIVGVTNFGDGISEGAAPHIWKGGFRGKSAVRGRGWGLPMVQEIISLYGGEVGLIREQDPDGSTFWFSIPAILEQKNTVE